MCEGACCEELCGWGNGQEWFFGPTETLGLFRNWNKVGAFHPSVGSASLGVEYIEKRLQPTDSTSDISVLPIESAGGLFHLWNIAHIIPCCHSLHARVRATQI